MKKLLWSIGLSLLLTGPALAQEELPELKIFGSSDPGTMALSHDQQVLAVAGRRNVRLWDLKNARLLGSLPTGQVTALGLSPDGKHLAAALFNQNLQVWNLRTLQLEFSQLAHQDWTYALAFSPDSKQVITGSFDQTLKLWNVLDGKTLGQWPGHRNWIHAVSFTPDGRGVVSASEDQTVRVWTLPQQADSNPPLVLTGHVGHVSSVAVNPEGTLILSGSQDRTARVWNLQTGQHTLTLTGHTDAVILVAFSPTGGQMATAALDQTVRLWDSTGQMLHLLKVEKGIQLLHFSLDGQQVLIGTDSQELQVWDVQTGTLKHTHTPKF